MVFDLETTGLSARTCRICELGAVRVRALELVDCFQSLVDPGVPLPQPVARLTGLREQRPARRSARRDSCRPLPVLRRRRTPRRAQRPLRPAVPRAAAEPARELQAGGAAAVHGSARPPPARRPPDAGQPLLTRPFLRGADRSLSPRATRRGGDRPGPRPPDRARAGAGRPSRLRAAHPRCSAQATCARQASAHPRRADAARACTSSATATSRCSTSAAPATCARACVPTSRATRQRPSVEAALLALERDRVARPRLRARGRARGTPADPAASAARQLPQPTPGPGVYLQAPRRRVRRHQDADGARPDRQPPASCARRPGACTSDAGGARAAPRRTGRCPAFGSGSIT